MTVRISLKHLDHITKYKQVLDSAPDWGLGNPVFVPTESSLAMQPGMNLKHKDLSVVTQQTGLTMSI